MEYSGRLLVIGSKESFDGVGSKSKNHLIHGISKLH